jgi:hypothetical protein
MKTLWLHVIATVVFLFGTINASLSAQATPSNPVYFPPSAVPVTSPLNYSECWSVTSYLLDLHWNPQLQPARDGLAFWLFRPIPIDPTYVVEHDWLGSLQTLHMARSTEFSVSYLLQRLTDTVQGGSGAMAPGSFGRLRFTNLFDVFFHVGPDHVPSPGLSARPFISLVILDPFDFPDLFVHNVGDPGVWAEGDMSSFVALHNYVRDHGMAVSAISHVHIDHWWHNFVLDGFVQSTAQSTFGAGREPIFLCPDEIYSFVQSSIGFPGAGVRHLTEAQPFVEPVPGTAHELKIERISTYQDSSFNGVQDPDEVSVNGLKISFPDGPIMVSLNEGTYLDLTAFQSYVPQVPDYVLGTGNNTATAVLDWLLDVPGGGLNGAEFIPTGYHNWHAPGGWVAFPSSDPNATLPGFVQFFQGG